MTFLAEFAWLPLKVATLILSGGVAAFALRKSPPASRHTLWCAIFLLVLALPAAGALLPTYSVDFPAWTAPTLYGPNAETVVSGAGGTTVAVIWLGGVIIVLARELCGQVELARWSRRARDFESDAWRRTLSGLDRMRPRLRTLRVLESDEISGPCTWGVLRPVLLVPSAGGEWSEQQRRDALIHEFAHINRFDFACTLIGRLVCALHWYNPLIWFAAAEARRLQEEACDDRVLLAGARAPDYAEFLVTLSSKAGAMHALPAFAEGSPLQRRIRTVLASKMGVRRSDGVVLCLVSVLAASAMALASATPAAGGSRGDPLIGLPPQKMQSAPLTLPLDIARTRSMRGAKAGLLIRKSQQPLPPLPQIAPLPPVPSIPPVPSTPTVPQVPSLPPVK